MIIIKKKNLVFYLRIGFFVGLGIGLFVTSFSSIETIGEGITTTNTKELSEYVVMVLRWAFATSLVSGLLFLFLGDILERK